LFTIQERLLLDRYDREYAGIRDVRRNAMQQALVDSTADFIVQSQAGGPSPSEDAAEREEQEIFAKLLEQLPPEHREPLLLRQEGLKVAEIAKRLGVTEGVVAGRIARATRRLAEMSKTLRADTEDG
jgi:RNA polymerase sigma factor (sigma-70 family)